MKVNVTINGRQYEDDVEPRLLLVHYIRDKARLTGTHVGCDTASCGACTVMLNGRPIKSCVTLAVQADGQNITTIEGVSEEGLHPVQQAFIEKFGFQCGYCTSGMIISTISLLERNPNPTDHEIREALEGNLCMCTGYQQIIESITYAATLMKSGAKAAQPAAVGK